MAADIRDGVWASVDVVPKEPGLRLLPDDASARYVCDLCGNMIDAREVACRKPGTTHDVVVVGTIACGCDSEMRFEAVERLWKVRVTIFSGPDFRTPHVNVGALYSDIEAASAMANRARDACGLLGIPLLEHDGSERRRRDGTLRPLGEGEDYHRVG